MPEPIPPPCPASPLPTRTWRQTHGGNRRHAPLPPEYALPEAAPASCGRRNTLSGRAVAPERLRRFSGSSLFPLRRRGYAHLRQCFPPSGTRGRGNLPLLRRVRPSAHIFVIFPPCPFLPAMIQLSAVLRDKARVLLQFPFHSGIPASPVAATFRRAQLPDRTPCFGQSKGMPDILALRSPAPAGLGGLKSGPPVKRVA